MRQKNWQSRLFDFHWISPGSGQKKGGGIVSPRILRHLWWWAFRQQFFASVYGMASEFGHYPPSSYIEYIVKRYKEAPQDHKVAADACLDKLNTFGAISSRKFRITSAHLKELMNQAVLHDWELSGKALKNTQEANKREDENEIMSKHQKCLLNHVTLFKILINIFYSDLHRSRSNIRQSITHQVFVQPSSMESRIDAIFQLLSCALQSPNRQLSAIIQSFVHIFWAVKKSVSYFSDDYVIILI